MSRENMKSDFEEITDSMIDTCLANPTDKARKTISVQ